ncbi:MAG: adenylate/guanylate cyclase domain-containing protein [Acidimicrobiales bacterium]
MEIVVLMFTDVEGSTRAWASDPGMLGSLEQHDGILRAAIRRHGGHEFKHTGDGLCVTFPTVAAAVSAAVDSQRALSTADWHGPDLKVRIAVHAGTAHRRGEDWFGLSLSRCARLMAAGHGGQVLLSGSAASMMTESPVDAVELADLGLVELRDLAQPEHVWQVLAPGLRVEFPVLRQAHSRAGNVPAELSSMIGRADEIEQVRADLGEVRLVVLTGTGGIGKTRLAMAVAGRISSEFSGGIWMVELAAAGDPNDVDPLVSGVLGFVPRPGLSARESIIQGIGDRELLLVLDNCERVLDAAADFASDVLRRCPRLRILATSRQELGVDGERVVRVPSLRVDTDAVELFMDRAHNADPSFRADPRALIEEICRRLDGIPLAIELAAARVRTLRLPELVARLGARLDVLTAGRGRVERHKTLRAALDWSWDLLGHDERVAFARCSVFAGRFDLDAAEAIVAGTPLGDDVLDVLSALVDKSMVVADMHGPSPFRLLEPLRQYAAEQLSALADSSELARRHASYYADLGGHLAVEVGGPNEMEASTALDAARDNLRAAFAFAVAGDDADLALRVVAPLGEYTNLHVWAEPWSWCAIALTLPGAEVHPLRAPTLVHASLGAWQLGDHTGALALADQAIALVVRGSRAWCDAQTCRAFALTFLGRLEEADAAATSAVQLELDAADSASLRRTATMLLIRNLAGRPEPELAQQLLDRASASGPTTHALALHVAAVIAGANDRATAIAYNQRAVEMAAASNAVLIEGFALVSLAALEAVSDPASGARRFVDVMAHYLRVGNHAHLRGFGRGLIDPLVQSGAYEPAATVAGATRADDVLASAITTIDDAIARAKAELGVAYDAAATRGENLTDDQLVHYLQRVVADL